MSWTRRSQVTLRVFTTTRSAVGILDGQGLLPIFPITVLDAYGNGRADRFSMAHAGQEFSLILFDFLPSAAPVSELPPVHLAIDEFQIDRNARGQSGDPGNQRLPVRFAGREESQHFVGCSRVFERRTILPDAPPLVKQSCVRKFTPRCLDVLHTQRYAVEALICTMATLIPKTPESASPSPAVALGDTLKRKVLSLQSYSQLVGDAVSKVFTAPHYPEDVLEQMDAIGVGSLPIILLTGFFIGGVMVLNTAQQFQRFGETSLTGDVVAIALVRELGPTITALLVAGRNASGIASELGSMVVTEQVDAMRALGTDPVRKLVVPRLIATVLTLPLLTAVADLVGLFGGFLVSHFTLHLSASEFWHRSIHALVLGDLVQGMVKPLVFAAIIATVGCYQGLQARGGTEGVGRATTTAVVVASVAILVSDFFLGKLLIFWFLQ